MALAEAQAVGTPVAGFDIGGVREAVWTKHHHHLVQAGQWAALLETLKRVLWQEVLDEQSRQQMRRWAAESFSAASVVKVQLLAYGIGQEAPAEGTEAYLVQQRGTW